LFAAQNELISVRNEKMGATRQSEGQYSIECEKQESLPELTFTLGGHDFSIGPEDYVFDYGGGCISAIFGRDAPPLDGPMGPFALLGTVFLRKWYSVFDLGRQTISFARAKA
jgi:saccharopepsin